LVKSGGFDADVELGVMGTPVVTEEAETVEVL
jgi:hypothetical protein